MPEEFEETAESTEKSILIDKLYVDIQLLIQVSNNYLNRLNKQKTRISFALERRLAKQLREISKKAERELSAIYMAVDNSYVDLDGDYVVTDKFDKPKYKKGNDLKRNLERAKKYAEYQDTKTFKIEPILPFVTDIPKDLTFEELHQFSGIIIPMQSDDYEDYIKSDLPVHSQNGLAGKAEAKN